MASVRWPTRLRGQVAGPTLASALKGGAGGQPEDAAHPDGHPGLLQSTDGFPALVSALVTAIPWPTARLTLVVPRSPAPTITATIQPTNMRAAGANQQASVSFLMNNEPIEDTNESGSASPRPASLGVQITSR